VKLVHLVGFITKKLDYEFRVPASLVVGQQKEGWTRSRCLDHDFYDYGDTEQCGKYTTNFEGPTVFFFRADE